MTLAKSGQKEAIALADPFCREAELRIDEQMGGGKGVGPSFANHEDESTVMADAST